MLLPLQARLGAAALLVAVSVSCAAFQRKDDPAAQRAAAVELTREGLFLLQAEHDRPGAEAKFRKAIAADSEYADARTNLAVILSARGLQKEAMAELKAAVKSDSNSAAAHNNLGVAYDRGGSPGLAVNEFKRALELDPRLRGTKLNLAVAYGHLGRNDLSITTFLEILREEPKNVQAYAGLGAVYTRAGKFESAAAIYAEGLKAAPGDSSLNAGLAVVHDAAGDPTSAVEAYDAALKANPSSSDTLAARGALALRMGDFRAATAYLSKMSNLEWAKRQKRQKADVQGLAETFYTLGDIHSNSGQYSLAAREYARAVTLDPKIKARAKSVDPDAHFALAVVYQEAGYLREAKGEYELVLRLRPDDWAAWRNLGETHYELGNLGKTADRRKSYELAGEAFVKAVQLRRDDARTHYDIGLLYYRQANIEESYLKKGKYRLAELEFQNALSEYGNDPELHLNMGVIFDQLGQYSEAAASYARAATLAPDSPVAYFLGGMAERNEKQYRRAIVLLEKAVALDPENQDPLYALGIVYQDMNNLEKAEDYFGRAAKANARGFTQGVTTVTR